MRADAARNRARILDAARDVFRDQGYDASLDLVAKRAGVGPGTLYRHFPNRESLVDALMQRWAERVVAAADEVIAEDGSDREILLRWFSEYVRLISLHKGGAAKITWALDHPDSPTFNKAAALRESTGRVLAALGARRAVRGGVDATQLCRLVGGVAAVADQSDLEPAAVRPMLEMVADGILVPAAELATDR